MAWTQVTCIALVTLLSSYPVSMTRVLSSDAIHALFEACDKGSGAEGRDVLAGAEVSNSAATCGCALPTTATRPRLCRCCWSSSWRRS